MENEEDKTSQETSQVDRSFTSANAEHSIAPIPPKSPEQKQIDWLKFIFVGVLIVLFVGFLQIQSNFWALNISSYQEYNATLSKVHEELEVKNLLEENDKLRKIIETMTPAPSLNLE